MQVSIKTLMSLITVRSDTLTKAAAEVLADKFDAADYSLTQADANAIAAVIDRMHDDNPLPEQWFAEMMGKTPAEIQFDTATENNQAGQHAMTMFKLAGLDTPSAWCE